MPDKKARRLPGGADSRLLRRRRFWVGGWRNRRRFGETSATVEGQAQRPKLIYNHRKDGGQFRREKAFVSCAGDSRPARQETVRLCATSIGSATASPGENFRKILPRPQRGYCAGEKSCQARYRRCSPGAGFFSPGTMTSNDGAAEAWGDHRGGRGDPRRATAARQLPFPDERPVRCADQPSDPAASPALPPYYAQPSHRD